MARRRRARAAAPAAAVRPAAVATAAVAAAAAAAVVAAAAATGGAVAGRLVPAASGRVDWRNDPPCRAARCSQRRSRHRRHCVLLRRAPYACVLGRRRQRLRLCVAPIGGSVGMLRHCVQRLVVPPLCPRQVCRDGTPAVMPAAMTGAARRMGPARATPWQRRQVGGWRLVAVLPTDRQARHGWRPAERRCRVSGRTCSADAALPTDRQARHGWRLAERRCQVSGRTCSVDVALPTDRQARHGWRPAGRRCQVSGRTCSVDVALPTDRQARHGLRPAGRRCQVSDRTCSVDVAAAWLVLDRQAVAPAPLPQAAACGLADPGKACLQNEQARGWGAWDAQRGM
eukprot:365285-Chlamydomonas_euryale.AAC.6